ncbi:unnamed protein product [Rotaria sp. Silwood2]|nr:unnamed protein product [Rotaria sp. Silwood2]CAF2589142.1 unnamed protein product [Rotaria sp. Silwood2]CAF2853742.1 unnamed protein product [Rotaria sp. Silwood2]CAF4079937.1 unnamed protein product [Rotaria sp. Silwood2]CAF4143723.1 unnamed protein product [Rotaria sp. Silwood2]
MLDQLRVKCILCAQTGLQRGNFVDHINKVCPKSVIQCQAADIKCPWKGPRDELQNHITTCVFEPLRPVLSLLIAETRQLIDQVKKHDNEIKELTQKMYQLQKSAKFKRHGALTVPLFRRSKIISNINVIIDGTDKLLDRWRAKPFRQVHMDIIEQCQKLLLEIFGLIAFDYNLEAIDDNNLAKKNELTQALQDIINMIYTMISAPRIVSIIYLKCCPRYRRAHAIVERYLNKMVEREFAESSESRAQRKKTSLIASLVSSLQIDEKTEARKMEEEKKGKLYP